MEREYKQFWTETIGKIRKRTGRNIELGVTGIEFLRFQASASGWLSSALFRFAARRRSVWRMSNIIICPKEDVLTLEGGADMLPRNVGYEPNYTVKQTRRTKSVEKYFLNLT